MHSRVSRQTFIEVAVTGDPVHLENFERAGLGRLILDAMEFLFQGKCQLQPGFERQGYARELWHYLATLGPLLYLVSADPPVHRADAETPLILLHKK